jgi:hypothetical protein
MGPAQVASIAWPRRCLPPGPSKKLEGAGRRPITAFWSSMPGYYRLLLAEGQLTQLAGTNGQLFEDGIEVEEIARKRRAA